MQALTNRSRVVVDKRMSWMERLYLPAIVGGLAITIRHLFRKKVSVQYPEQERPRAAVWRGWHVLKRDEKGRENCTACGLCAVACPAEAITMTAAERKPGGNNKKPVGKTKTVKDVAKTNGKAKRRVSN